MAAASGSTTCAWATCTSIGSSRCATSSPLYDREIRDCDVRIHRRLKGHPGYQAVQALRGVGPVLAAVFVAEIGDVTRFDNPSRLCSWAGLTPRHRESDTHVDRGRITKTGLAAVALGRCRSGLRRGA